MSVMDNFRAAYVILEQDVSRSLHTQVGDAARLGEQRDRALRFLANAEQVGESASQWK